MAERAPASAADATDDQDERSTGAQGRTGQELLTLLARAGPECEVWSEQLNGRFVCFVRHDRRTYVVLPLEYAPLPGREHPPQQEA